MSRDRAARVVAGVMLAATLGAGAWWAGLGNPRDGDSSQEPFVNQAVVTTALTSRQPRHLTLTDEIDHFRARLAARGDEGFSHARLASAHLLRFRAYGREEDLDAAERYVEALGGPASELASVAAIRASLHLTRHEFTEAVRVARHANSLAAGREPAYWLRLFDAFWAAGRLDEAAAILRLPLDSASIGVLSRTARVLDRSGDVERARDQFRVVVELVQGYAEPAPVEAWALVELGHFEHHAGDPARAVVRYLEALRVLPGSPAALEGLAAVASGVDRAPNVAAQFYRHALEQGGHLDLMARLAEVEEEGGNHAAAQAVREAFIERATATPRLERLYRRPLAFVLADDPATICRAFEYARSDLAERRDSGAWDALAWVRYHMGELDDAWRAAQKATAEGVPEPGVALRAGLIARSVGERDHAESLLGSALSGASELSLAEVREARRVLDGEVPAAVGPRAPGHGVACALKPPYAPLPR